MPPINSYPHITNYWTRISLRAFALANAHSLPTTPRYISSAANLLSQSKVFFVFHTKHRLWSFCHWRLRFNLIQCFIPDRFSYAMHIHRKPHIHIFHSIAYHHNNVKCIPYALIEKFYLILMRSVVQFFFFLITLELNRKRQNLWSSSHIQRYTITVHIWV